jgi:hypothetical protein
MWQVDSIYTRYEYKGNTRRVNMSLFNHLGHHSRHHLNV